MLITVWFKRSRWTANAEGWDKVAIFLLLSTLWRQCNIDIVCILKFCILVFRLSPCFFCRVFSFGYNPGVWIIFIFVCRSLECSLPITSITLRTSKIHGAYLMCDFVVFFCDCDIYEQLNRKIICGHHSYRRALLKFPIDISAGFSPVSNKKSDGGREREITTSSCKSTH
jgi:hypothetical protein